LIVAQILFAFIGKHFYCLAQSIDDFVAKFLFEMLFVCVLGNGCDGYVVLYGLYLHLNLLDKLFDVVCVELFRLVTAQCRRDNGLRCVLAEYEIDWIE
jgi:hypothetical protein